MGNSYSEESLASHIDTQISKLRRNPTRFYLNIKELLGFEVPDKLPIPTNQIALIYAMDSDKNGKFTAEKISRFLSYCKIAIDKRRCSEADFEIQAVFQLIFAEDLAMEGSERKVVDWLTQ